MPEKLEKRRRRADTSTSTPPRRARCRPSTQAAAAARSRRSSTSSNVNVFYGTHKAVADVNFKLPHRQITALIGPSGCGKSTFIRCLNRMNDLIPSARVDG